MCKDSNWAIRAVPGGVQPLRAVNLDANPLPRIFWPVSPRIPFRRFVAPAKCCRAGKTSLVQFGCRVRHKQPHNAFLTVGRISEGS